MPTGLRKGRGLFGRVLVVALSHSDPLRNRFLASPRTSISSIADRPWPGLMATSFKTSLDPGRFVPLLVDLLLPARRLSTEIASIGSLRSYALSLNARPPFTLLIHPMDIRVVALFDHGLVIVLNLPFVVSCAGLEVYCAFPGVLDGGT